MFKKKEILIIFLLALLVLLAGYVGYQSLTVPSLTSTKLLAEKYVWVGKRVKARGTAMPSDEVGCTEAVCPSQKPCCNSCSASLTLDKIIEIRGRDAACVGDNCSLTCQPLQNDKVYVVEGIWKKRGASPEHSGYPDYWLELKVFSEIKPFPR